MKNIFIFFFIILVQPIFAQENRVIYAPDDNCLYVENIVPKYFDVPEKFLDYTPLYKNFEHYTIFGFPTPLDYTYGFFIIKEISPNKFYELKIKKGFSEGFSIPKESDDVAYYSIEARNCYDCESSEEGKKLLEFLKMSNKFIQYKGQWFPVLFGEYDLDFFLSKNTNRKHLEYYYKKFNMFNNSNNFTRILVQRPRFTKLEKQ